MDSVQDGQNSLSNIVFVKHKLREQVVKCVLDEKEIGELEMVVFESMVSVKVNEKENVKTGIFESFTGTIVSAVLYEYFLNI